MSEIDREILKRLYALQDIEYQVFQSKLIPTVDPATVIGVRTPALREYAKELSKREDVGVFLAALPHADFGETLAAVDAFLPYVDNWATCDQLSPKVFRKHRAELLPEIKRWMASEHVYTIRFGVGMLMQHYLDEDFDPAQLEDVAALRSGEYYVNMMIAWYFATALAKQYDATLPYLEQRRLDAWTHNKAIQKAIESYRVTDEHKAYLRMQKIKK